MLVYSLGAEYLHFHTSYNCGFAEILCCTCTLLHVSTVIINVGFVSSSCYYAIIPDRGGILIGIEGIGSVRF